MPPVPEELVDEELLDDDEHDATVPQARSTYLLLYRDGDNDVRELGLTPLAWQILRRLVSERQPLAQAMREGIELKGDGAIVSGFRVSLVDDNVEHDFTEAAITTALCELLRPHIADIVKQAMPGVASPDK